MNLTKSRWSGDSGWTFIEATLSVVIMSIMVLGLTIVLMAFREHLDRSWAVRVMDQYGNDVVERLTHELRNAVDLSVRRVVSGRQIMLDQIDIVYLDPFYLDRTITKRWRPSSKPAIITVDGVPLDPYFPPRRPGRGEVYEIRRFTLTPYGQDGRQGGTAVWSNEVFDSQTRNEAFKEATYLIRFKLHYTRSAVQRGNPSWTFDKEYFNRVYIRNMNLPIRRKLREQAQ